MIANIPTGMVIGMQKTTMVDVERKQVLIANLHVIGN